MEEAFVDIDKSSISVYNDIEVLKINIDVSSISYCVDIKFQASISKILRYGIFNIVLLRYRVLQPSISTFLRVKAFDIECPNLRYRVVI